MLSLMESIYEERQDPDFDLKLHGRFLTLWTEVYAHLHNKGRGTPENKQHIAALKKMLSFIQLRYKEKISLAEIAAAGNVCKTGCNSLFRKYTGKTPVEYLNDYRLRKSIALVKSTNMTLTAICYETGFSGASYFAESFRRSFGCSPSEYKKRASKP